jgi:hypothetical protein
MHPYGGMPGVRETPASPEGAIGRCALASGRLPMAGKPSALAFAPGDTFKSRGQIFRFLGWEHYTNRLGRDVRVAALASRCADCGAPFTCRATRYKAPTQCARCKQR